MPRSVENMRAVRNRKELLQAKNLLRKFEIQSVELDAKLDMADKAVVQILLADMKKLIDDIAINGKTVSIRELKNAVRINTI